MRLEPVFPLTADEEIQVMLAAFERKKNEPRTKEDALAHFIAAGIFDEDGNPTEPYKELYEWIRQNAD